MYQITKFWIAIACILLSSNLFANNLMYKSITFDTIKDVDTSILQMSNYHDAVICKNHVLYEYEYEQDSYVLYKTFYKRIVVFGDKGISDFNKLKISLNNVYGIESLKIRTISPSHEVRYFDASSLRKVESDDKNGSYQLYAIEGLQKGSVLDIICTLQMSPVVSDRCNLQCDYLQCDAKVALVTPHNLIFDMKIKNQNTLPTDSLFTNGKYYQAFSFDTIEPLEYESYSAWEDNRIVVDIAYVSNTSSKKNDDLWTKDVATLNKKCLIIGDDELKIANKYLKQLNLSGSDFDKIYAIERYVKDNFQIKNISSYYYGVDKLDFIFKNNYTNEVGIVRLFVALCKSANIDFQLGFTTNRFVQKFTLPIHTQNYLTQMIMYFPSIDKYLYPTELRWSLGNMMPKFSDNKALFIDVINIDGHQSVMPEIKNIPANTMSQNCTKQNIKVAFDLDSSLTIIDYQCELSGVEAARMYYLFEIDSLVLARQMNEVLNFMGSDTRIKNYRIATTKDDLYKQHRVSYNSSFSVGSLIEHATDMYLFNLGQIIGSQVEMYSARNRKFDIEIDRRHSYKRTIELTIPDGYMVDGLELLNMNIEYFAGTDKAIGFTSQYSLVGNKLLVDIYEYYSDVFYKREQYDSFRTIINAAADFNKVAILLRKL